MTRRDSHDTRWSFGMPYPDTCIPTRAGKDVLLDVVPVDAKHLAIVFGPISYRMIVQRAIPQLDRSIAGCGHQLILVRFGKGNVVQAVLRVEHLFDLEGGCIGGEREDVEATVANETVVGGGGDGESVREEG